MLPWSPGPLCLPGFSTVKVFFPLSFLSFFGRKLLWSAHTPGVGRYASTSLRGEDSTEITCNSVLEICPYLFIYISIDSWVLLCAVAHNSILHHFFLLRFLQLCQWELSLLDSCVLRCIVPSWSSCIYPTLVLEWAISPRTPGSFYWRINRRTKMQAWSGLLCFAGCFLMR